MSARRAFWPTFAESVRMELPYWLLVLMAYAILGWADSEIAWTIFSWSMCYVGVGVCLAFLVFRIESTQDPKKFDMLGAVLNLYRAMWWPWYLFHHLFARR